MAMDEREMGKDGKPQRKQIVIEVWPGAWIVCVFTPWAGGVLLVFRG